MADDRNDALHQEIAQLSKRVSVLENLVRQMLSVQGAPDKQPPTPTPSHVEKQAMTGTAQTSPTAPPPPPIPPVPAAPPPARERPDSSRLEQEIGGNWLNRIAAVALTLAAGFFLKYAFDNNWINETGQVIIGVMVGLGCIAAGEYFQSKGLNRYAQGLTGAGIAILYVSIYAAAMIYHLIAQMPAFAFMFMVTVSAIALSVRYDAVGIAILGIIGGFLTPVLLNDQGTGRSDNSIGLLTYITILDLGILGITRFKGWRELNLLSLAGTVLVFAGWYYTNGSHASVKLTMFYLTLYYIIFAAQSFVQNVIAGRDLNEADVVMAIAAPVLYFGASYGILADKYHIYLGAFAIVMAMVYLLLAQRVLVSGFQDNRLGMIFLGITAAFLTIAVPIQLKLQWITIGWAVEGAILGLIGFYTASRRTRFVGLGLLALAGFRLLTIHSMAYTWKITVPLMNQRFFTFLVVIGVTVLLAWLYVRYKDRIGDDEEYFGTALVILANFFMIWALSLEALTWVGVEGITWAASSARSLALSAVWLCYGILLLMAGIAWRYLPARLLGVVLLGIVILKSFLVDVWSLEHLYRIIAFVALGVMLFIASYFYHAYSDRLRQIVTGDGDNDAS